MTKVKICGITNLEDALLSVGFGADFLGFNFYRRSPRFIYPLDARKIIEHLPISVLKVGVFVNETREMIEQTVKVAGLTAIQLHGDETADFVADLRSDNGPGIIKVVRVSASFKPESVLDYAADAILLDAFSKNGYGGTGETFDWNAALEANNFTPKLYLAGGLTPENVADAVSKVNPYAVDVASGVESVKGKKDAAKLEAFIKNAKSA